MVPARYRILTALALYGVLSVVFCWPLFEFPNGLGVSDWDQHLFYYGSVLKNVVEYGQMPFWNPWYCGGNVLWQNPQIAVLSLVYPLASVVSLALAMKINIVLHYWIGFVGMHLLLTRILKLAYLPLVVYLASIFTLAGGLALHLNAGHSVFLPAFYLPLLLFLFLRCVLTEHPRDALPGAAVLALTIYNGGLHIVPIALVMIGGIGLFAAVARRRWRPLLLAFLLGAAGFSYAAPKVLPIALFVEGDQLWDTRTGMETLDRMDIRMMLRSYLDPYQNRSTRAGDFQRHKWFEYGNYIGSLAVILTMASGVWVFAHPKHPEGWLGMSLAATTVLLLAFSAGEFSGFAPASLAGHFPLLSSFRVPSRYTIAVPMLAAVTIGWVAKSMAVDTSSTGSARMFVGLVCTVAVFQLLTENRVQFNGVFPLEPLNDGFHFLARRDTLDIDRTTTPYGSNSPMLRALASGQSFYNCYEALQLRHTADADHAMVFGGETAKISKTRFSPNRIEFSAVNGREPSRVVLNQNYAAGWRSSAGPVTPDPQDGKPSVMLAPGQAGRFSFVFVPPGLWLGLAVFASAVIGSAVLWRRL
jgi:multisubunit Na+/H+ antiporter MnhC subunit